MLGRKNLMTTTPDSLAALAARVALTLLLAACCLALSPPAAADDQQGSDHGDLTTLVLKLYDDMGVAEQGGRLYPWLRDSRSISAIEEVEAALNVARGETEIRAAVQLPKELLDAMRQTGKRRTGRHLADLSQFFVLHLADEVDGAAVLDRLLAAGSVQSAYAYRWPVSPVDITPTTPSFTVGPPGPGQGYRNPAPEGVDAPAAIAAGVTGAGVTVADVEANWNLAHEDLDHLLPQLRPVPMVPQSDWLDPALPATTNLDHGTATLGVIAGGTNAYGVTGLAPGAQIRVVPTGRQSDPFWIAPDAVLLATLTLQPGDVLLLEVEVPIGPSTNLPFETFDLEYAVVEQATALGLHVIEPAGNTTGGLDLDNAPAVQDPTTGKSLFDVTLRDSGAILVGAGDAVPQPPGVPPGPDGNHNTYPNSNFGTRVGTYAWGRDVTTLGYGPNSSTLTNCANPVDPFPPSPPFPQDPNQWYTHCYNGTSSAGAIIAGVAALLEENHRAIYGQPATPAELRNLLELGTPSFGAIGHQPDLLYHFGVQQDGGVLPYYFEAEPRFSPTSSTATFGAAVTGGRDVNGDGVNDMVVAAPKQTIDLGGGAEWVFAGRVYVYSGADGSTLLTIDGGAQQDRLGTSVALGDVNADGVVDIVAGAVGAAAGQFAGAVQVHSGIDGSLLYTLTGAAAFEQFGTSVAVVGDVDGDGGEDFVVGVPQASPTRAELYSGLTGTLLTTFSAGASFDRFGYAVAAGGDLNQDGVLDVLVGAPDQDDANGATIGEVFAYSWNDPTTPILTLGIVAGVDSSSFAEFGSAVDAADLDGDGVPEIVVGAPGYTFTPSVPGLGKVYVYNSAGLLLDSFEATFNDPIRRLGSSVAMVGDFDGDGFEDVAAGAPSTVSGSLGAGPPGRVTVYLGPFPQPVPAQRVFPTKDTATLFGAALAAVGDVNADGRPDLLAGETFGEAEGRAFVLASRPGPNPLPGLARLVADPPVIEAWDTDGDGFGGGGLSPSSSTLQIDAGAAWANEVYLVVAMPDFGTFLSNRVGFLDGSGATSAPVLGPVPSSILCQVVGLEIDLIAAAISDTDADGVFDSFVLTNWTQVEVINEFNNC